MVVLPTLLFLVMSTIVLLALVWSWRNDALRTTDQERVDMEFERIVQRLK